jgi:hypothetical protein
MKIPSIPFKIPALAPLFGPDYPVWDKAPLDVDPDDPDGRVPVRIALKPSRQILASRDKMVLDFAW